MKKNVWTIIGFLLFLIFMLTAYQVVYRDGYSVDSIWLETIFQHGRTTYGNYLFQGITFFASVVGLPLLALLSFLFLKDKREKWYFLGNIVGSVAIGQILKFLVQRERPLLLYQVVSESGYSCPSGHSMIAASFYGYFIYLVWNSNQKKRWKISETILLLCLIISIGFSRIYLGVHYTSDVVAGLCLGGLYTILWIMLKEGILLDKQKNLAMSFYHAFEGIKSAFLSERNMKIHTFFMIAVVVVGFYFHISTSEWIICLILFGVVIAAEIMNTAIETTVDIAMPKKNPKAKLAKDLSAGAVLVLAVVAAIIGLIIFLPKIGI